MTPTNTHARTCVISSGIRASFVAPGKCIPLSSVLMVGFFTLKRLNSSVDQLALCQLQRNCQTLMQYSLLFENIFSRCSTNNFNHKIFSCSLGSNSNYHSQGVSPGAVAIYYSHVQQFVKKRASVIAYNMAWVYTVTQTMVSCTSMTRLLQQTNRILLSSDASQKLMSGIGSDRIGSNLMQIKPSLSEWERTSNFTKWI